MAKITANLPCNCIFCGLNGTYENGTGEQQFFTIANKSMPWVCKKCVVSLSGQIKS